MADEDDKLKKNLKVYKWTTFLLFLCLLLATISINILENKCYKEQIPTMEIECNTFMLERLNQTHCSSSFYVAGELIEYNTTATVLRIWS